VARARPAIVTSTTRRGVNVTMPGTVPSALVPRIDVSPAEDRDGVSAGTRDLRFVGVVDVELDEQAVRAWNGAIVLVPAFPMAPSTDLVRRVVARTVG
jgi:hypothetical protein